VDGVLDNRERLVRMVEEGVAKMFDSFPTGVVRPR
jgi:hypothetical protein